MRRFLVTLFAPLAALLGCDAGISQLKPGVSTATEVRSVMGNPTFEWKATDGATTWEFARGPEGVVTYMVDFGPDNVMRALRQVLTEEYFAKIQPGMHRDAVRRLIGRPGQTMPFPNLQEEVWSWRFEQSPGNPWFFNAHFAPDGMLKRTTQQKIESLNP
jgi:outer membrane protein assembly factor BamE (lipoprotein component of BamABCDE complex)